MAADLARLEEARREFIARISHDLRTPLTAIKGLVVNLQDTAPEAMQASLSTMDEQTDRLIRLVNDLLALSRLQRGELCLVRAEIDLAAVARSAVSLASERARRLGVVLTINLPSPIPPVLGDADRLQQVVVNLLDNALRATPAGGTVEVRVVAEGNEVLLTVIDSGCGLTAEQAMHAFEPTFRGPGGGTGLGLTIARDLVAAHGGRIWLQNRPEGGAEAGFALLR
jgi:signal transduction histidine kinase